MPAPDAPMPAVEAADEEPPLAAEAAPAQPPAAVAAAPPATPAGENLAALRVFVYFGVEDEHGVPAHLSGQLVVDGHEVGVAVGCSPFVEV